MLVLSHITLRKGWRSVPFSPAEITPALSHAAKISAWIRSELDRSPANLGVFTESKRQSDRGGFLRSASAGTHPDINDGSGFKLRMLEGSVHEYLWSVKEIPKGSASGAHSSNPDVYIQFIRDLVHYTFRDGRGYVEGLTAIDLDRRISEFGVREDVWRVD